MADTDATEPGQGHPEGTHQRSPGLSAVIDLIAPGFVDDQATLEAGPEGARRFEAALNQGVTITVSVWNSMQTDITPQMLGRGVIPPRPFGQSGKWLVNERQVLMANGAQVVGPLPAGRSTLTGIVETGNGFEAQGFCEARQGGPDVTRPVAEGQTFSFGRSSMSVESACRWYLGTRSVRGRTLFALLVTQP